MKLQEINPFDYKGKISDLKDKALKDEGAYYEEAPEPNYSDLDTFLAVFEDGDIIATGAYREPTGPVMKHIETGKGAIELKNMHVKPERHREGLGSWVLEELEEDAVEEGYDNAVLEIIEEQDSAEEFYEAHGYEEIKTGDLDICGREYTITFYEKEL